MSRTRTKPAPVSTLNGNSEMPQLGTGSEKVATLRRLAEAEIVVQIIGKTPLIPHKWSEKALNQLRTKHFAGSNSVRPVREPKNAEEDAHQSCYWVEKGVPGMPSTAFKAAMVDATRFFQGITAVFAKQLFSVKGEGIDQLVRIDGKAEMFESTPRNSGGTVDLRYRMRIFPWSAELRISYVENQIDVESIVALVDAAGRGGVGDWRPSAPKSKTGTFGTWSVKVG